MREKIFIFDGYSLIYRGYYALLKSPRITSYGLDTSAVYGFVNIFLDILDKEKPDYIAIALDTHKPTWRHQEFPQYKSTRLKQPEQITSAFPFIKKFLEAFKIKSYVLECFEADDIIGTISKKILKNIDTFIVTSDKDYDQLVNEHTFIYKPDKVGYKINKIADVLEKWEIDKVEQVIDILALQGDVSDNIPGVPGIGEKTSRQLIKQFSSVEHLLENISLLQGRQKEKIEANKELALLSKKLVTIVTNVPIDFVIEECKYKNPDLEKLKILFRELEFKSILRRMNLAEEDELIQNIDKVEHKYFLLQTEEEISQLMEKLWQRTEFAIDTETTGLDFQTSEIIGISISYKPNEAFYIPTKENTREKILMFKQILESEKILKIGQNIKFDHLMMKKYGIDKINNIFDTMIAHAVIEPEMPHGMDDMSVVYLNYKPIPSSQLMGNDYSINMKDVALETIKNYAAEDADVTLQLKFVFDKLLKEKNLAKLCYEIEFPLVQVLVDMEYEGINIDTEQLQFLSEKFSAEIDILTKKIYEISKVPFNINSPKQLVDILFGNLQIIFPKKKTSNDYSTEDSVLQKIKCMHPIVDLVINYRELTKLKSTYLEALEKLNSKVDQRIHTTFNQTKVKTGRLSSSNPNLQNIPTRTERGKLIRNLFIARDKNYKLLSLDYSQIELRIVAALSKDETMIKAFGEDQDIHLMTASNLFKVPLKYVTKEMRQIAKSANFGMIYGISSFGLAQQTGISQKDAALLINDYFQLFSGVKKFIDSTIERAHTLGYTQTLFGRKQFLRNINSRNKNLSAADERNAINTPIQGTAAELIKIAMIKINNWLGENKKKSKLVLQVHDELVFDTFLEEFEVVKTNAIFLMENAINLEIPILVQSK
ncbi:MAG: DNA polymerase I [Cytophagales bacterium]|jgi:DNA polymerase-1|nr:DNA polymerase I [Cytophagales bacterium]